MSATGHDTPPDQQAELNAHANAPSFVAGVYRGQWTIETVNWPIVEISVAAEAREGAPDRYLLRCDFTNYPAYAPTATPWDPETKPKLVEAKRPKGEHVGMVFRVNWEDGNALYAAYDRVGLAGHPNWQTEHPRTAWDGTQDLTWWVLRVWELLNDDDYTGI